MHNIFTIAIKGIAGGVLVVAFSLLLGLPGSLALALAALAWLGVAIVGYLALWR